MTLKLLIIVALVASPMVVLAQKPWLPPTTSRLTIISPSGFKEEYAAGIDHTDALFGVAVGDIIAPVFYTGDEGCNKITLPAGTPEAVIVMVDRGGCDFTMKGFNVGSAGAAAMIVADIHPICGKAEDVTQCDAQFCSLYCPYAYGPNPNDCACLLPVMNDDMSHRVDIPSMLITRDDAEQIKKCLDGTNTACGTSRTPVLHMSFPQPAPDNRVEWEIWSTSNDEDGADFRNSFEPLVDALGKDALFTPHYFIYDGVAWGCTTPGDPCGNQCTNEAHYCAPDPDRNLDAGATGADVIAENLRQICIFKQANETVLEDNAIRYWEYTKAFSERCTLDSGNFKKSCSDEVQLLAGIDPVQTDKCVANSGGLTSSNNTLLANELKQRNELTIFKLPTVVVNQKQETGSVNPTAVLTTICAGFQDKIPDICACAGVKPSWLEICATKGPGAVPANAGGLTDPKNDSSGLPGWATFLIVVLVLAVIGLIVGGFLMYRRVHSNMRSMIEDYRRLDGDDHDDTALTTTRV